MIATASRRRKRCKYRLRQLSDGSGFVSPALGRISCDVPKDAYSTAGNRGQYVIVVPSHDLVIVRRGLDWGRQGFNRWDLTREVLKAFGENGSVAR